jgi:hypothetical protein
VRQFRITLMFMAAEKLEQALEKEWEAAEEALKAAQKMPGGPERIAALRKAGQMRFDAYEKKRHLEEGRSYKIA